jgi:uncharacterized protein YidB (DUF937 family)
VEDALAKAIPTVVDTMTPDGVIPDSATLQAAVGRAAPG